MRSVLATSLERNKIFLFIILVVAIGIAQAVEATLPLANHDIEAIKSIERTMAAAHIDLKPFNRNFRVQRHPVNSTILVRCDEPPLGIDRHPYP